MRIEKDIQTASKLLTKVTCIGESMKQKILGENITGRDATLIELEIEPFRKSVV